MMRRMPRLFAALLAAVLLALPPAARPAMALKPGVSLAGLQPELALAAQVVCSLFEARGHACVVTSGSDGRHAPGSKHYVGLALDFRTRHVPARDRPALAREIAQALPGYLVLLEPTHLHVQLATEAHP